MSNSIIHSATYHFIEQCYIRSSGTHNLQNIYLIRKANMNSLNTSKLHFDFDINIDFTFVKAIKDTSKNGTRILLLR